MTLVPVQLLDGGTAYIRQDTAEELGIKPNEVIGFKLFAVARLADYEKSRK